MHQKKHTQTNKNKQKNKDILELVKSKKNPKKLKSKKTKISNCSIGEIIKKN